MRRNVYGRASLVAVVLLVSMPAFAANNSWNSSASAVWHDPTKWSLGVVPTNTQTAVFISNATSKTVTNNAVTSGSFPGAMTISNLTLSAPSTATTNTLLLSDAGLVTPLLLLDSLTNLNGCAVLISNSILRVEGRSDGDLENEGTIKLISGMLIATGVVRTAIGDLNRGNLTVNTGTFLTKMMSLGADVTGRGTWTIEGGSNVVSSLLHIGEESGASGTVWQTGGKLLVNSGMYVGEAGIGQMTVSNGTWEVGQVFVAYFNGGIGVLTLVGGTNRVTGSMYLSDDGNTAGSLWVTGGSLTVTNASGSSGAINFCFFLDTGSSPTAQMIVSNAATVIVRDVNMGFVSGSQNTLRLAGGTMRVTRGLTVGKEAGANATMWMTGGQLTVTNAPTFIGSNGVGQAIISNGTVTLRELIISRGGSSQGTLTIAGGSVTADSLTLTNVNGRLALVNGMLQTRATAVTNGQSFLVGNNVNPATLDLLGGMHSFAGGLRIATNAFLTGWGVINSIVTNAGTCAPTGNFTVNGNLVQQPSARLAIDIAGYSQFDSINSTGMVTLAGTLTVSLANGFESQMTNGASFTVLTGNSMAGAFANVASGGHLVTRDGYADFVVTYGGGNPNVVLGQLKAVDSDADGMPDWWELANGLAPNNAGDAVLDADGDGQSNLAEFLAGTDPHSLPSVFRVISIERQQNDVLVTWSTVGGKRYRVQASSGTASGGYTNDFLDLEPPINMPGLGEGTTNYLDSSAGRARYYRVKIIP